MIGEELGDEKLRLEISRIVNEDKVVAPWLSELAIQEDLYHKVEEIKEVLAMPNLTNE